MRLYKRGDVWWASWTENHVTVRRSTKCRDRVAANLVAKRWEREQADPDHAAANQATVASAAKRFLGELGHEEISAGTLNMYECKVGHVVRLLGNVRLADLSHEQVKEFTAARERETAVPHTIHRELTSLRRILQSAARAREFSRDPRSVLPKYSARYTPRTRYLHVFEWAAIKPHLEPDRRALVGFMLATGARWGEVRRAQREDIGQTTVALRGSKTARSLRKVPIVPLLRELLDDALAYGGGKPPMLFRPWGNMRRDIAVACRRAGMDSFTANDLRRTTGTWLLQWGVPMEVVAKFMGHASTAMLFRVYGQLGAEDLGRLIDARLR